MNDLEKIAKQHLRNFVFNGSVLRPAPRCPICKTGIVKGNTITDPYNLECSNKNCFGKVMLTRSEIDEPYKRATTELSEALQKFNKWKIDTHHNTIDDLSTNEYNVYLERGIYHITVTITEREPYTINLKFRVISPSLGINPLEDIECRGRSLGSIVNEITKIEEKIEFLG